jgi:hypothetical protein
VGGNVADLADGKGCLIAGFNLISNDCSSATLIGRANLLGGAEAETAMEVSVSYIQ